MKLLNTIKIATLTGLAALALPMAAQAALSFGNWDVGPSGGNAVGEIAGCPSGVPADCTVLVSGEGFLQQQYSDTASGNVYIQTIVTDPNADATDPATLAYSDESFVRSSGTSSGIAGKQSMSDASFNFTGSTTLYTGWAADAAIKPSGEANLNITQGFSDNGGAATGDEFSSSFGLKINLDGAGNQTGKSMSIGQVVEMGNGIDINTTDIQRFVIEQRSGDVLTTGNTGFKLGNTSFDASNNALNGTNNDPGAFDDAMPDPLTWQADDGSTVKGDDVMLVWLGQQVGDGSAGGGLSVFGYESATVVGNTANASATADQYATTFSTDTPGVGTQTGLTSSAPFNWDIPAFGAAPTLPTP